MKTYDKIKIKLIEYSDLKVSKNIIEILESNGMIIEEIYEKSYKNFVGGKSYESQYIIEYKHFFESDWILELKRILKDNDVDFMNFIMYAIFENNEIEIYI